MMNQAAVLEIRKILTEENVNTAGRISLCKLC